MPATVFCDDDARYNSGRSLGTRMPASPTIAIAINWIRVAKASTLNSAPVSEVAHSSTRIEAPPETTTQTQGAPLRVVCAKNLGNIPSNAYANSMRVGCNRLSQQISGQKTQ